MLWLISLFNPVFYVLLSLSSVDFFSIEKNVISFLVLGIVPGTNIQFDFYFLFISIMVGSLSLLVIILFKQNKLSHLHKLLFTNKQAKLKNISI
jgi:hypothetical protein